MTKLHPISNDLVSDQAGDPMRDKIYQIAIGFVVMMFLGSLLM